MQLLVRHRFEAVEGSGKQHKFSWFAKEPGKKNRFLCHAMYQSGDDMLPVYGGGEAPRGYVLRIQCDKDESTMPGSGLELRIHDDHWNERNYRRLARQILSSDMLPTAEHKAAVLSQLASLYNLLATQYSITFDHGIPSVLGMKPEKVYGALDEMVTDAKAKTLSQWFSAIAAQALEGETENLPPLKLPPPRVLPPSTEFSWRHVIETQPGNKLHHFIFKGEDQAIAKTLYQSGALGGGAVFIGRKGNQLAAGFTLETSDLQGACIPFKQNFGTIDNEALTGEQKQAAYVMLASLYRLTGTRYGAPFGYPADRAHGNFHPLPACEISDAKSLEEFINPSGFAEQAEKSLRKAAALIQFTPQSQLEDTPTLTPSQSAIRPPPGVS